MSGAVGKAAESAAGTVTVTAANVKSVMIARRRASRAVVVGSMWTRMFSSLRSVVLWFTVYVRVVREKR
jgi:hypothetical protein